MSVSSVERSVLPAPVAVTLSRGTWDALVAAFLVLAGLLGLTAVTLVDQRDRTVRLNRQMMVLEHATTALLRGAGPALTALPHSPATIAGRASSAAALVDQARPLLAAARPLVSSLGSGPLAGAVADLDHLAVSANDAQLVTKLVPLLDTAPQLARALPGVGALVADVNARGLIGRAQGGLENLSDLVSLQRRLLGAEVTNLATSASTHHLTAVQLDTTRSLLGVEQSLERLGRETLEQVREINAKLP